jgi:hypothetical protein
MAVIVTGETKFLIPLFISIIANLYVIQQLNRNEN